MLKKAIHLPRLFQKALFTVAPSASRISTAIACTNSRPFYSAANSISKNSIPPVFPASFPSLKPCTIRPTVVTSLFKPAGPSILSIRSLATVARKANKKNSVESESSEKKQPNKRKKKSDKEDESEKQSEPQEDLKSSSTREKTVEEIYQRKTPIEHVLVRPDTYVGTTERLRTSAYVLEGVDLSSESNAFKSARIVSREMQFVPAMYKVVDELLVNAVDNYRRAKTGTNVVKVEIDHNTGWIRVYNNGKSVPVQIHSEENIYVPQLVFGNLLTGSNFDDEEMKFTGGRNGYGAKLANIFSREFVLEIKDSYNKKHYQQRWTENMSKCSEPVIRTLKPSDDNESDSDFICVSFLPDYARFSMPNGLDPEYESDTLALLYRRVFDLAACNPGLTVYLNNHKVPIHSFAEYVKLFFTQEQEQQDKQTVPIEEPEEAEEQKKQPESEKEQYEDFVFRRINKKWEIGVGPSMDGAFNQVSFVNSIATRRGGTHVQLVSDYLVRKLTEYIEKRYPSINKIPAGHIRNNMAVFVNCLVENPAFDSQTKETLTTKPSHFGSPEFTLPDSFIVELAQKTKLVSNIVNYSLFKQTAEMDKKTGKKPKLYGIPKLDDANLAGTEHAHECTLILTEGDSAKALAVAGLSVVGRDRFGVFPLKGKLLNVRDAPQKQISDNAELSQLRRIIGLSHSESYETEEQRKQLRYGRVMLMCDQDHDGSHIKGLFINMLHKYWPALLKCNNFLYEFVTPIIKVCHASNKQQQPLSFFTIAEFEEWRRALSDGDISKYRVKYYKGLGTSTAAEGKEYFRNIDSKHRISFQWARDEESKLIEMAFSKSMAEQRKRWLSSTYVEGVHVDHSKGSLTYEEFINKELILFSNADNVRSIPSVIDGLKPGQRKVIYGCFKRKLTQEIKVAQLAGYISEHTGYHHGEASLHNTIINMAQNFVGSNNIPLLVPSGQFGTRLQGGKDAASPRYIFTYLNDITRKIFPEVDDNILVYREEDGEVIEPEYYIPIIPMVLVNGAEGLGTGWSTYVPSYNPIEIIDNLIRLINNDPAEPMVEMLPYFRGFTGTISFDADKKHFVTRGVCQAVDTTTLRITELPIGKWTEDYKMFLESLAHGSNKIIKRYTEQNTDETVDFTLSMSRESLAQAEKVGFHKKFKLESVINANNMHLFDPSGTIKKYTSPLEIIQDFFGVRLEAYNKRKQYLLDQLNREVALLQNKTRFLELVCSGKLKLAKKKKSEIVAELEKLGFARMSGTAVAAPRLVKNKLSATITTNTTSSEDTETAPAEAALDAAVSSVTSKGYEYLLNIPLWNLTSEYTDALNKERKQKETEFDVLQRKDVREMWKEDLESLREALMKADAKSAKAKQHHGQQQHKEATKTTRKKKVTTEQQ